MYYRLSTDESPFQRELLALLQTRLAQLAQAGRDQTALREYLGRKVNSACG
jgi:hypothetical protein